MRIFFLGSLLILSAACKTGKMNRQSADELIHDLRAGILLVRLQTSEKKVAALQQLGESAEAASAAAAQAGQNQKIRGAFAQWYDFSPVYFFSSTDSRAVREKNFANILTDAQGNPVSAGSLSPKPIFAAEFGEVISNNSHAGLNALIVLDDQLRQLKAPFPFATPTHLYLEEEMESRTVARFNQKLHEFFAKAAYREQKRDLKRRRKEWRSGPE